MFILNSLPFLSLTLMVALLNLKANSPIPLSLRSFKAFVNDNIWHFQEVYACL